MHPPPFVPLRDLLIPSIGGIFLGTVMLADAFNSDHVQLMAGMVAFIGVIVGAVVWIDKRIAHQIGIHNNMDHARYKLLRVELRHLRDLFAIRAGKEPLPSLDNDDDPTNPHDVEET